MGQVHVRDPHRFGFGVVGAHKIASYIAKYCGKEMQRRALDQKRYFRSRGIVVPEVDVDIQDFATRWLWTYNHDRPNMALGGITLKQKLALAA